MTIERATVLADVDAFRRSFASTLAVLTTYGVDGSERAAAQEALQLVWSFAVCDLADGDELDDQRWELLRDVFPDEFFEPEPDETFVALSEKVPNSYAERWKYFPSDLLAGLMRACITAGDAAPLAEYREVAVRLAADVCATIVPMTARGVFDTAKYDTMLKRARILTEVATAEAALPDDDQIRSFCVRSGEGRTLSFAFMALVDPEVALEMLHVFTERHGQEVARDTLRDALDETIPAGQRDALATLLERISRAG